MPNMLQLLFNLSLAVLWTFLVSIEFGKLFDTLFKQNLPIWGRVLAIFTTVTSIKGLTYLHHSASMHVSEPVHATARDACRFESSSSGE